MTNQIAVTGTIATEPRLITHPNKAPWCSFRIAVNNRYYDPETRSWVATQTDWFNVHTWRSLARNAAASLKKGERIVVRGKLRIRNWEKDDRSGTAVEIEADSLGHDLLWGTSVFTKSPKNDSPATTESPAGDNRGTGTAQADWVQDATPPASELTAEDASAGFIPA